MAARIPKPSAAVLAARARKGKIGAVRAARIEWFIENVSNKIQLTLKDRLRIAVQLLQSRVVENISRPVTKGTGPRGGRVVLNRSKPGEFPKADTTQLMKTIFVGVRQVEKNVREGFVGTPLDYGLILETRMNRSFLLRTLNEERGRITRILTGPIR